MSTLITGGTVVTADGNLAADVLIVGEKIAAVLARGEATDAATFAAASAAADAEPDADVIIDATDMYVIPGGIDAHTHMEMPFGGTFSVDTFETGTKAAALRRDHHHHRLRGPGQGHQPARHPGQVAREGRRQLRDRLRLPHDRLRRERRRRSRRWTACIDAGVTSFKMFMAYPGVFYATDGEILLGDAAGVRAPGPRS